MPDNNKDQIYKIRKTPIALGFAFCLFLYITNMYGGKSIIFSSLEELSLAVSIFLALTVVFSEIKKLHHRLYVKTANEQQKQETANIIADHIIPSEHSDDLVEIQRGIIKHNQTEKKRTTGKGGIFLSVLYIVSFIVFAFWYLRRITLIMPLSFNETYRYGVINAVLLLIIPFVSVVYLKMRKGDGTRPGDVTSHSALMMLSYVSLIYAAVISAGAVLKINLFFILQWTYYAVSIYFIIALAVNIFISILIHKVLGDFDYALAPKIPKGGVSFWDSEEMRINFSLKSLWTFKYTMQILPGFILIVGFILFLSTTVYVVQPHQQAAVYRLGKLNRTSIVEEGLYFKFPWPVDRVDIYDVHRVSSMQIGYLSGTGRNFLWGRRYDGSEYLLLLGNGNEMAAVNIKIVYKISDLYSYVRTCTNPEDVLSAAVYEELMRRTINTTLDAFLSIDRGELSVSLSEELSEFCKSEDLGLTVVEVIVESIHPPIAVADIYQSVVTASINKNTTIINAKTDAEKQLTNADQQRKTVVFNARAEQYKRVSGAIKEMAVYHAAAEAYKISHENFRLIKYLDTYETIIKGNKVFVFSPGTENDMSKFIVAKDRNILLRDH